MSGTLGTKKAIFERMQSLTKKYQEAYAGIEQSVKGVRVCIADIDAQLQGGEAFDEKKVKEMITALNSEQTRLVNTLKTMTEIHAKMGYAVK